MRIEPENKFSMFRKWDQFGKYQAENIFFSIQQSFINCKMNFEGVKPGYIISINKQNASLNKGA